MNKELINTIPAGCIKLILCCTKCATGNCVYNIHLHTYSLFFINCGITSIQIFNMNNGNREKKTFIWEMQFNTRWIEMMRLQNSQQFHTTNCLKWFTSTTVVCICVCVCGIESTHNQNNLACLVNRNMLHSTKYHLALNKNAIEWSTRIKAQNIVWLWVVLQTIYLSITL